MGKAALLLASLLLLVPALFVVARGVGTLRGRPMIVYGKIYRGSYLRLASLGLVAWGIAMTVCAFVLGWVAVRTP